MKFLKAAGIFLLILSGAAAVFLIFTAVGPNGKSIIGTTRTFSDTVVDIYEGGEKDVVFKLKDNRRAFYINRGLEKGLSIESLKALMLNQPADFSYAAPSSHINELVFRNRTIYTENQNSNKP